MKDKQSLINAITRGEGRDYLLKLKPSLKYEELESLALELLFITDRLIEDPALSAYLVKVLAENLHKYLYDDDEEY